MPWNSFGPYWSVTKHSTKLLHGLLLSNTWIAVLSDSFRTMLVACSCLIRCPASVINTSDSSAVSVLFIWTIRALNLSARLAVLLYVLSSLLSPLFFVIYWSNRPLAFLSNVALYFALTLSRFSYVCQVNQQSSFLQIKQLFGCDRLLRFVRLYCGRLN
jgi:hypothetical protein